MVKGAKVGFFVNFGQNLLEMIQFFYHLLLISMASKQICTCKLYNNKEKTEFTLEELYNISKICQNNNSEIQKMNKQIKKYIEILAKIKII
jgi:hypothetical protein